MITFIKSNIFLTIVIVINVLLLILYILSNIKLSKLRKNYASFMSKLGKGNNIDEMLEKYVKEVEDIKRENQEISTYCKLLENKTNECVRKIGLVRYNAYKDTGSNLSFALAILKDDNSGVVFNGIYSRDSSNIYCKTVTKGTSEYALSEEEIEAIGKAVEKE